MSLNDWNSVAFVCAVHPQHCAICETGIAIVDYCLQGVTVFSGSEDCPNEIDHVRCYECALSAEKIPENSDLWQQDPTIVAKIMRRRQATLAARVRACNSADIC